MVRKPCVIAPVGSGWLRRSTFRGVLAEPCIILASDSIRMTLPAVIVVSKQIGECSELVLQCIIIRAPSFVQYRQ